MSSEELSSRKRISVQELRPGMYVVGLDRSWLRTPFLFHRKLIKSAEEIERLKLQRIHEVVIDTALGADVDGGMPETQTNGEAEHAPEHQTAAIGTASGRVLAPAEMNFQPLVRELHAAQTIHEEALSAAQSIFDGTKGGAPVNCETANKVAADLHASIARSPEANLLLIQLRRFQKDLFAHAVNVCVLTLVVSALERLEVDAVELGQAALLHDIGETRVPRNLLRKQAALTDAERRLVEQHPKLGALLLEQSGAATELTRRIVLEHHERIDGSGFPNRIRGEEISLLSQIVAITDAYDELLSDHSQAVLQPNEALRHLFAQSNAGALDRGLVERIIRCLGIYPVGSLVELNTGERALA